MIEVKRIACGTCAETATDLLADENFEEGVVAADERVGDAAEQATRAFLPGGLPYVRVHGSDGRVFGFVVGNHMEQAEALVEGHVQR